MPGEFVFYQGDYGDKFYILLKGGVQVLVHNSEYGKKGEANEAAPIVKRKKGKTAPSQGFAGNKQGKPTLVIRGDNDDERSLSKKSDDERMRSGSTEP